MSNLAKDVNIEAHEELSVLSVDEFIDDTSNVICDLGRFVNEARACAAVKELSMGGTTAEGAVTDLVNYVTADLITPSVLYAVLHKNLREEQKSIIRSAEHVERNIMLAPAKCVNCTLGKNVRLTNDSLDTVIDAVGTDIGGLVYDRIVSLFPEVEEIEIPDADLDEFPEDGSMLTMPASEKIEDECLDLIRSVLEDIMFSTVSPAPLYSVEEFEDSNSDFIK